MSKYLETKITQIGNLMQNNYRACCIIKKKKTFFNADKIDLRRNNKYVVFLTIY